jgi:translocation protein SEC62
MQAEAQKRGMTLQEFQAFQRRTIEEEAKKLGITPQEFVMKKQAEAREQMARQQAQGQGAGQPGPPGQPAPAPGQPQQRMQQLDITKPVEAKPEALALAKFLRVQDLKTRTVLFNGQRKDMFKGKPDDLNPGTTSNIFIVKRAIRALLTDKYKKAQTKDALLPKVENEADARTALQVLPLNMLALRVSKKDPHEGHNHAKPKKEKRVKGLWDVKIEHQQQFEPMMHYIWIYEGSQWKTKVWAALAVIAAFIVVLFPLWPLFMRQGVWYLSVGAMGLLIAFFGLGIVRLILFCLTVFTIPPGLWIFPNLFEDVGFFDSFKPLYEWGDSKKQKKSKKKKAALEGAQTGSAQPSKENAGATATATSATSTPPTANGTAATSGTESAAVNRRHATVEEADDE